MKIKEIHEAVSDDLPGVDANDTHTEKFFPGFEEYSNVVEHGDFFDTFGDFFDTFDEALKFAGEELTDHFITFDFSKYAPGESAETDIPESIWSVLVIKPLGNDKFDVVQSKPEQLLKDQSKSQLDLLIRKLSKKLEHEDIEIEFRVLGY